jgi:hypothetical protein
MSIDKLIGDAIKAKPRHFITKEILHSVLVQESELCSTFERSDEQYRLNMSTAIKMTGKTEAEILKLVTLQTGKIAKFRLEPSYFNKEVFKKEKNRDLKNCLAELVQIASAAQKAAEDLKLI